MWERISCLEPIFDLPSAVPLPVPFGISPNLGEILPKFSVHPSPYCYYMYIYCSLLSTLSLFSHESKVHNLNYHLNCAIWIIIQMTEVWIVCTPNYIAMCHLKFMRNSNDGPEVFSSYQYLSNHVVKSLYECIDL